MVVGVKQCLPIRQQRLQLQRQAGPRHHVGQPRVGPVRQPGLEAERVQGLDQRGQIDRRRKTLDHQLRIEGLAIETRQARQEPQRGWGVYVCFRISSRILMHSLHALSILFVVLTKTDYASVMGGGCQ